MKSTGKPIVVVGSINMDFVVTTRAIPAIGETVLGNNFQLHHGGKGANQAVAVARLGYPVEMIGKVGSDIFGEKLRTGLRNAGAGVDAVDTAESSSGIAIITVSQNGENTIVVTPGANAHVMPQFLDRHSRLIQEAGMVLAQLEIPLETIEHLAALCHEHGVPLMLDPAPAQQLPSQIFPYVSWFTPNETEAAFFAQRIDPALAAADSAQVAAAFHTLGVESIILKMGRRGVLLAPKAAQPQLVPAPRVNAIDTTAAGDAFNGAFATALMLGREPAEAARFACAAAALSVTRVGAQPSMPTRKEVEALLENRG